MDLSPEAYADLHQDDPQGTPQNPRPMIWHLAPCGSGEAIRLQYQTQANAFWSSLWVRNSNVPLATVAVKSAKHPSATPLRRGTDGTYTDDHGFGDGPFTLTLTSVDGRSVTQSFAGFTAGSLVETTMQFQ